MHAQLKNEKKIHQPNLLVECTVSLTTFSQINRHFHKSGMFYNATIKDLNVYMAFNINDKTSPFIQMNRLHYLLEVAKYDPITMANVKLKST